MRCLLLLALLLAVLLVAPAGAQTQFDGNPFNDNATPTPAPTATPAPRASDDEATPLTLYLLAGGALVVFVGIGVFITRDARRNLTPEDRRALDRGERGVPAADDERMTGGMRGKAKSKARKKNKSQRQARKANRPR